MIKGNLFHISEEGNIKEFNPRPSPSNFKNLNENVVFAIGKKLLHNYLLPRECPRVSYHLGEKTTDQDKKQYLSKKNYVLVLQQDWIEKIKKTTIFCYQFNAKNFEILDENANYYISKKTEIPNRVTKINTLFKELVNIEKLEIKIVKDLKKIAEEIQKTSLNYSFIRMRNLKEEQS